MNKSFISITCAVSCSFLWGTAFIAQDTGMDYIGPWTFSAARLILGFFALLPFFLMIRRRPRSTRKESSAASDVYKRQL